jgi:uncharacterized lipoprotein YbaY
MRQPTHLRRGPRATLAALVAAAATAGCSAAAPATPPSAPPASAAPASVTGVAAWTAAAPLPADAVLDVTVADIARADAPAITLAEARTPAPTAPAAFAVPFDPARLDPRALYSVRVRILSGERLLYTSDRTIPVLGAHGTDAGTVTLVAVAPQSAPDAPLVETYWALVALGTDPLPVGTSAGEREVHVILHGDPPRVSGYAGCNRLAGAYTLDGPRLAFGKMASTMMACPTGMDVESRLHAALAATAGWRVRGERLELLDAKGAVLATFERRLLR